MRSGYAAASRARVRFQLAATPPLDEPAPAFVSPAPVRLLPLPGASVPDVADSQPQEPDYGPAVGEPAAAAADLPQPVVQRFDAVGRADHAPRHGREPQERREPVPRPLPRGRHRRIFAAELAVLEPVEPFAGPVRVRRPVHVPQPGAHLLAVRVGHEPVRRADEIHHAGLHHRLRPCGPDGPGQALQPVAAHDRHVHDAPVGHPVAHARPERGSLRIPYPDARHAPEPRPCRRRWRCVYVIK